MLLTGGSIQVDQKMIYLDRAAMSLQRISILYNSLTVCFSTALRLRFFGGAGMDGLLQVYLNFYRFCPGTMHFI
jgi:hypothetical protein